MSKSLHILFFTILGISKLFATDNYPVGARAIGLSNAFVSISDTWSTFHNQATLANFESFSAGIFYESKFMVDELSLSAGSVILPVSAGTFGFSFYQFGQNTYKEHKIGLAYAIQLSKRINAAIQLDYYVQRFPENNNSKGFPTFEMGITYKTTQQLTLGAHILNPIKNGFETPNGKQRMPFTYRIGGHYQFSDMVLVTAEALKNNDHPTMVKTGLEFSPVQNMALRFGISGRPVQYTAGLGYKLGNVFTDIAFSYHGSLGFTPSLSIQFNL